VSIGDALAEGRRQAGLTVTQVSQQTRIRESIIRAIEQGDFSSCGGDFYARGHIRSIAAVVGTDPAPLIREYDEEHGPPGAISAADVFEPSTPIKIRQPRSFPLGKVLAVALVLVAGFGVYRIATSPSGKPPVTPVAALRPTPTTTTAPAAAPRPTRPAFPRGEAQIRLTATQDCWVGITDASGKQLYNGVVQAGKSMTWLERHRVAVRLGNPSGITLVVNGRNATPRTITPATVNVSPEGGTTVA